MNKRQAEKIFVDGISGTLLKSGYVLQGKRCFVKKFFADMISVRIFPEFSKYYCDNIFDTYVEVKYTNYSNLYKDFMREKYDDIEAKEDHMLFMKINKIIGEEKEFHNDIDMFLFYIDGKNEYIQNYIADNFSTAGRLLSYLVNNKSEGGIHRSLSTFVLLRDTQGKESACSWIRSGEPRTGSEMQRDQLVYLNSICQK